MYYSNFWSNGENCPDISIFSSPFSFSSENVLVDSSNFRPDSESVRERMLGGKSSSDASSLQYDDPKNPPSRTEVLIRSGKLSKADIYQLEQQAKENVKNEVESNRRKKAKKAADKLASDRQKYFDEISGFERNEDSNS